MKNELAQHDIEVVALSKDSVEAAATHKRRDGISMPLLADPTMDRQFAM